MSDHNAHWLARRDAAVSRGLFPGMPIVAARAENTELWDVDGRRFIDFAGGIAVLNTGHRHPRVMARVRAQLDAFTHTCAVVVPYAPYVEVCERLNAIAPISGEKKSLLVTTGAEAVENAVKYARAYTGRSDVIAFDGAFHGRTNLAMALTGKVVPYKAGFGPFAPGIWHVPFPVAHRGHTVAETMAAIESLFKCQVEASRVAAIIIEPVQGEGGFYIAPTELLVALRQLCDTHGILLVADEIQSGFGRTGRWFAIEHSGVEPDLIAVAKSLAGGFPLAGVVGRAAIMDAVDPGRVGGTYAGNPVSCAAALGVFEAFAEERLLERASAQGARVLARLQALKAARVGLPIGDVRGLGAMVAFEVVTSHGGNESNAAGAKALAAACLERGLIVLTCGLYADTVRLLWPLTASDAILDEGLTMLESAARELA